MTEGPHILAVGLWGVADGPAIVFAAEKRYKLRRVGERDQRKSVGEIVPAGAQRLASLPATV